ncbi:hypothetical protein HXX76_012230 [Chlamydomonas incerta]|uniref:SWIM-type domain-containing protein n=1 Tax=Chlamydomonas incerta TaxID=51695 RepID=A0A835SL64_CHLIN|nr:hypothetical protein HXX76_012230 [Chlamydomonas incerta]|eukprot:KAG2427576.1 hypothetical protein HXX76_012230 [Chlamydomonas incerta]
MKGRDAAAAAGAAGAAQPAGSNLDEERRQQILHNLQTMLALGLLHDPAELQQLAAGPQLLEPRHATKAAYQDGGVAEEEAEAEPSVQTPQQRRPARTSRGPKRALQADDDEGEVGQDAGKDAEEAEARKRAAQQQKQAKKLLELEVEGLVEFDEDSAIFNVCGSTGNIYTVTLSDAKSNCTCPDHRFRRRDCKHIKLVRAKLQIQRQPGNWFEAVQRLSAGGTGGGGGSVAGRLDAAAAAAVVEEAAAAAAAAEAAAAEDADAQQGAPNEAALGGGGGGRGRARGRAQQPKAGPSKRRR